VVPPRCSSSASASAPIGSLGCTYGACSRSGAIRGVRGCNARVRNSGLVIARLPRVQWVIGRAAGGVGAVQHAPGKKRRFLLEIFRCEAQEDSCRAAWACLALALAAVPDRAAAEGRPGHATVQPTHHPPPQPAPPPPPRWGGRRCRPTPLPLQPRPSRCVYATPAARERASGSGRWGASRRCGSSSLRRPEHRPWWAAPLRPPPRSRPLRSDPSPAAANSVPAPTPYGSERERRGLTGGGNAVGFKQLHMTI
jgi:hypothetical protein